MPSSRSQKELRWVDVPLSLMLSSDLTPAAKFLWIRMRFDEMRWGQWSHRPRQLVKRTKLARSTVYEAFRQGESTGWLLTRTHPSHWKTTLDNGMAGARPVRRKRRCEFPCP